MSFSAFHWAWYGVIPDNLEQAFSRSPGQCAQTRFCVYTGCWRHVPADCRVRSGCLQDIPAVLSPRTRSSRTAGWRGQPPCPGHRAPGHWAPSDRALPLKAPGSSSRGGSRLFPSLSGWEVPLGAELAPPGACEGPTSLGWGWRLLWWGQHWGSGQEVGSLGERCLHWEPLAGSFHTRPGPARWQRA